MLLTLIVYMCHSVCIFLCSTYQALETVTEPHQVTATLQCVAAVSRALLSGGMGRWVHRPVHTYTPSTKLQNIRFPEGKKHLFSLLMLALPGIDANDFRKTIVSHLAMDKCTNVYYSS